MQLSAKIDEKHFLRTLQLVANFPELSTCYEILTP
jgi:hypothetical protein